MVPSQVHIRKVFNLRSQCIRLGRTSKGGPLNASPEKNTQKDIPLRERFGLPQSGFSQNYREKRAIFAHFAAGNFCAVKTLVRRAMNSNLECKYRYDSDHSAKCRRFCSGQNTRAQCRATTCQVLTANHATPTTCSLQYSIVAGIWFGTRGSDR